MIFFRSKKAIGYHILYILILSHIISDRLHVMIFFHREQSDSSARGPTAEVRDLELTEKIGGPVLHSDKHQKY